MTPEEQAAAAAKETQTNVPTNKNGEEHKVDQGLLNALTGGLPDDKSTEQQTAGTATQEAVDASSTSKKATIPEGGQQPPETVKPAYQNVWDEIGKRLSNDDYKFELPESVKNQKFEEGQTELDVLLKTIYENTEFPDIPKDDPFINDYLEAKKNKDFDPYKWIESKSKESNLLGLKNEDFLRQYFKKEHGKTDVNPDGYTDEEIEEYINSKNKIERDIEAENLKKTYRQKIAESEVAKIEQNKKDKIKQYESINERNNGYITDYLKAHQNDKDFFGIEFSEAEKTQYMETLPTMFKIDPETGLSEFDKFLQSRDNILSLAAVVWKGSKGMKEKLSDIKEQVKKDVTSKLGTSPVVDGGATTTHKEFNASKLV